MIDGAKDASSLLAECDARWVEARRAYWRQAADASAGPLLSTLQMRPRDDAEVVVGTGGGGAGGGGAGPGRAGPGR